MEENTQKAKVLYEQKRLAHSQKNEETSRISWQDGCLSSKNTVWATTKETPCIVPSKGDGKFLALDFFFFFFTLSSERAASSLWLTLKCLESASVALVLEWSLPAHSAWPEVFCKSVNCLLFRMRASVEASGCSSAVYSHANSSQSSICVCVGGREGGREGSSVADTERFQIAWEQQGNFPPIPAFSLSYCQAHCA